jgi:hypothetical protein
LDFGQFRWNPVALCKILAKLAGILLVGDGIWPVLPDSGHNHWNFVTSSFLPLVIFHTSQTPQTIFRKIIFSENFDFIENIYRRKTFTSKQTEHKSRITFT